jgi:hypothetical protein
MNTTAIITLILTFAITAPVIFIIANPHWLSYWRRRWVRLGVEADVANLQQPYFTDFIDLLTRLIFSRLVPLLAVRGNDKVYDELMVRRTHPTLV